MMERLLPFARLTQLLKVIEELPVPMTSYNRHRMEYDYILGKLCLGMTKEKSLTISNFIHCEMLGSPPTANKRIQELIQYQLISVHQGDDRRERILMITDLGKDYLRICSELMEKALVKT